MVKRQLQYDPYHQKYKIQTIKIRPSIKELNLNLYYEMVAELKILYTIITRARSVFVIYDSQIPKGLIKLWDKMDLITEINDKNIKDHRISIEDYGKKEKHKRY